MRVVAEVRRFSLVNFVKCLSFLSSVPTKIPRCFYFRELLWHSGIGSVLYQTLPGGYN